MRGDPLYYLATAIALGLGIMSIIYHEVAHAYAAFALGDPTAAKQGRLSANPLLHIDPMFTIAMPLLTYLSAGVIFGGPKPVPINPFLFKNPRKGMMVTGMAGPAVNVLVMLTCTAILRTLRPFEHVVSPYIIYVFWRLGLWNMILVVFNMIPIPPLDGSRLVLYLLPRELAYKYDRLERYGMFIVVIVVMSGVLHPLFIRAAMLFAYMSGYNLWN